MNPSKLYLALATVSTLGILPLDGVWAANYFKIVTTEGQALAIATSISLGCATIASGILWGLYRCHKSRERVQDQVNDDVAMHTARF